MITEDGCSSLAAALCANPSHLRELDLSYNHPGDSGVAILSVLKQDPQWRLDTLMYGWQRDNTDHLAQAQTLIICQLKVKCVIFKDLEEERATSNG